MNWKLRDGVSWAQTEYGGVLLDAVNGDYWTLNRTGAVVLGCLLAGKPVSVATDRIAAEFAADVASVAGDVPALVADLEAAGLVVRP